MGCASRQLSGTNASAIWLFQIICSDLFFHKSAFAHFLLAVGGGSGLAKRGILAKIYLL